MKVTICVCIALAAFAVLFCAAAPVPAKDWQGSEYVKDGVVHVKNPANPEGGIKEIELTEAWRLGGDTEDEDEFFGVIVAMTTDDRGNVYLLDAQLHRVMIYDAGGEFLRAIGREGEGPGEFRRPGGMVMQPDGNVGIVQRAPGRIVSLTPGGEPAENFRVPEAEDGSTRFFFSCAATHDRVFVGVNEFERDEGSFTSVFRVIGVSPGSGEVTEYLSLTNQQNMANFTFDEKQLGGVTMPWDVGADGTVYASVEFDGYRIDVWHSDGTPARVIFRDYASRERSAREMDRMRERIRVQVDGRQPEKIISKSDRDVQKLFAREAGNVWVLSSRGAIDPPEGSLGVFDVFDSNGRFTEQISLKGEGSIERDGYFFLGDRLYVVTNLVSARSAMLGGSNQIGDEEAAPISIICYEIQVSHSAGS